ncbi:pyridoxal phosphate-dependent decarboxylase family protein [Embleya sp. NPDC050154]|uniref:pyridoxal phosphate-dependent decarboxylase family protein n=1 Tax=Embleya sp. NPDC050154 TaxID=3363988 RepID=UPI0037BD7540
MAEFAHDKAPEPAGPSGPGLNLSIAQSRQLLETVSAYVLRFHQDLAAGAYPASYVDDSLDVAAYSDGLRVSKELREDDVPTAPTDLEPLLDTLFGPAMTNGTMHPHPGFMAHIPSGGLLQSAVADFVAASVNRFAGVWIAAPGFQQIERNVIRWYCSMLGYDEGSFGYLTTGGSIANLMALVCARRHHERISPTLRTPRMYVSGEGHFSISKAARTVGLPAASITTITTTASHTLDVDELIATIESDRVAGLSPMCVVATAGTTNSGAIDDLDRIGAYCEANDIWFHVDACFGGFFRITTRGKAALAGIERADSIAVDAHKSLFLPHGNSALLVRDRRRLADAFEVPGAAYLPGLTENEDVVDFCGLGPELSREIRGLTAWLPLKMHGIRAFEERLDATMDLAHHLAEGIRKLPGVDLVQAHPAVLPVVTFTAAADPADAGQENKDRRNARLCELICSRKNTYLTTTELPGVGLVVRACILHPRTDRTVVDRLLEDIRWSVTRLAAGPAKAWS